MTRGNQESYSTGPTDDNERRLAELSPYEIDAATLAMEAAGYYPPFSASEIVAWASEARAAGATVGTAQDESDWPAMHPDPESEANKLN